RRSSASMRLRVISSSALTDIVVAPRSATDISGFFGIRGDLALWFPDRQRRPAEKWSGIPAPSLAGSGFKPAGGHFHHAGRALDLREQCRVGTGHPHLRADLCEFLMERAASRRIEMG